MSASFIPEKLTDLADVAPNATPANGHALIGGGTTATFTPITITHVQSLSGVLSNLVTVGGLTSALATKLDTTAAASTYATQSSLSSGLSAKLNASAVSAFGLTLVDDGDAATARATLGLPATAAGRVLYGDASTLPASTSSFAFDNATSTLTLAGPIKGTKFGCSTGNAVRLEGSSTSAYFNVDFASWIFGAIITVQNTSGSNLRIDSNVAALGGATITGNGGMGLQAGTSGSNNYMRFFTYVGAFGSQTGHFVFTDSAAGTAARTPAGTTSNPTIRVYAGGGATPSAYVDLFHDLADATVKAGTGRIRLDSPSGCFVPNASSVPGTPTGGGVFYVEAGALKYKGSSGTISTIAPA